MVDRSKLKTLIPIMISLVMALFLVFLTEDFVQTVIVVPLLHVGWFLSLIIKSLPQGVLWVGLISIMLIISYARFKKKKPVMPRGVHIPTKNIGQVEKWTRLLESAQEVKFSKWRLANELNRLTRKLLSPIGENRNRKAELDNGIIPTEIAAFFSAPQPTREPGFLRQHSAEKNTSEPLDLDPEIVIQYLEEHLKS